VEGDEEVDECPKREYSERKNLFVGIDGVSRMQSGDIVRKNRKSHFLGPRGVGF